MYSLQELTAYLKQAGASFELIKQKSPIVSTEDARQYYDIKKAAPTFILESDMGLIACTISANHGKMDFKDMKEKFGFSKLKMADKKEIKKVTGYEIGTIPLVGHNLECIFDDLLLKYDFIYGGTGNELVTLKINPNDVKRLNHLIGIL